VLAKHRHNYSTQTKFKTAHPNSHPQSTYCLYQDSTVIQTIITAYNTTECWRSSSSSSSSSRIIGHNKYQPGLIKQLIRVPRLTTNGCRTVVQQSNQYPTACNNMSLVNPW